MAPSNIPTTLLDSLEKKNAELAYVDLPKNIWNQMKNIWIDIKLLPLKHLWFQIFLEFFPEDEREGVVSVAPGELPFPHLFKTG